MREGVEPGRGRQADSPTTSAMSPRRLANRYRLETLIGEGRTGVVYAAVDEMLGRAVAVKLLREEQVRGGDGLERYSARRACSRIDVPIGTSSPCTTSASTRAARRSW